MRFLNKVPLLPLAILTAIYAFILTEIQDAKPVLPSEEKLHCGIVEKVHETSTGQALTIKKMDGKRVKLTVPSFEKEFFPGDTISFQATLQVPARSNRHENDFAKWTRRNGIAYTAFASPDSITVSSPSFHYLKELSRLRSSLSSLLARSDLNDRTYEFLNATIIGDTSSLSDDTRQIFSTTGVAHILALSGLHVGIISGIILLLLSPLCLIGGRRARILITLILLWIYAIITGASPSVTRAVIMASAVGIGFMFGKRNFALNALCLAAILILLFNPRQIITPGFQMSFIAAAAIISVSPLISINRQQRVRYYLLSSLAVTVIATICAGAIAAFHFHSFPLYFIIANLPAAALLPLLLSGGILILAFEFFGIPSGLICEAMNHVYDILLSFITFISKLPAPSIHGLHFPSWVFIPYFITIVLFIIFGYLRNKKLLYSGCAGIALTAICFGCSRKTSEPEDHFTAKAAGHTGIVYRHNNRMAIISGAPKTISKDAAFEIERTYSDYLEFHGVDSVLAINSPISFGNLTYDGVTVEISQTRYLIVNANKYPIPRKPISYCVIAKGYRGDIVKTATALRPDTILLGADLDIRRHNRYAETLIQHDIPFRSLR